MTAGMALAEWIDHRDPVTVAGADLSGVYVGSTDGPEVIDPDLPLDVAAPDWEGASVEQLHYGELTPRARAAYLVWQRLGRRVPQAPPAWALLHLYGLERRVLVDGDDDPSLREEARALGEVYGHNADVARVSAALVGPARYLAPPALSDGSAPDDLQVELGRLALAARPIDATWALPWAWYHPDIARREAAKRAPDEFARLWALRFSERFPDGMPARPKRRRITLEYFPANPSLPSPLELTVADASDVFLTPGPAAVLREVTEQVEAELAAFAQWRTRYPDEPVGSVRAATALPAVLFAGSAAEQAAQPLVEASETLLRTTPVVGEASAVLAAWGAATGRTTFERRDSVELAQVLDRFGIGLEPDARFGGRALAGDSPVVVFRQEGPPTTSPSEPYAAALVTLELCAAVAAADGTIDGAEQVMLAARIDEAADLTDGERARLDAHLVLVTASPLRLQDVAARMVALPLAERHALASYLLDVARADGTVTDDEVQVLRSVHELLDLNPDEVERRLRPRVVPLAPRSVHGTLVDPQPESDESLLELAPAEELAETVAEEPATRLVEIDEDALRDRQTDNQAVQDLLSSIFNDEDETDEPDAEETPTPLDVIVTLDPAHSALLCDLAQRGHTSRRDLEVAASKHGVLPDGALDVINEAALDLIDDPVIEIHDDESVTVDHDVYEEMRA